MEFVASLVVTIHVLLSLYLLKLIREKDTVIRYSKSWWEGIAIVALNLVMAGVWAKDLV